MAKFRVHFKGSTGELEVEADKFFPYGGGGEWMYFEVERGGDKITVEAIRAELISHVQRLSD